MSGMILLAWMAVSSALLRRGGPLQEWVFLSTQACCLLSGMLEAGSVETGQESAWRRPARILALVTYVTSLIVTSPAAFP